MTFSQAIASAPEGTDFVAFRNVFGWCLVSRRSDDIWLTIAQLTDCGYDLAAAGISAARKSLWNAETGQFLCGTLTQLIGEPQA